MTFDGWDEKNPYTVEVEETDAGFVGTAYQNGEAVFASRACRLEVQARRLAVDWIHQGDKVGGIMLDVQTVSVDADSLFRRVKNG